MRTLKFSLLLIGIVAAAIGCYGSFDAAAKATHAAIRMIDGLALMLRAETVRFALAYRLPLMHVYREDVEAWKTLCPI